MVPEDALSIPDIARQLRVHQATVRLWINQGTLKAQRASPKPQARWWVRPEDLQEMLARRDQPGGILLDLGGGQLALEALGQDGEGRLQSHQDQHRQPEI